MSQTQNVTAIVTKAEDYRENDRIIRLFTMEGGMIRATVRGVKKHGATLKFCSQPFALCSFELAKRGEYYTVAGASQIESLFDITLDPERYAAGCLMLEASDVAVDEIPNPRLFVKLLRTLKSLVYGGDTNPFLLGAKYIIAALDEQGYGSAYEGGGKTEKLLHTLRASTLDEVCAMNVERSAALAAIKAVARSVEYHFDRRLFSLLSL